MTRSQPSICWTCNFEPSDLLFRDLKPSKAVHTVHQRIPCAHIGKRSHQDLHRNKTRTCSRQQTRLQMGPTSPQDGIGGKGEDWLRFQSFGSKRNAGHWRSRRDGLKHWQFHRSFSPFAQSIFNSSIFNRFTYVSTQSVSRVLVLSD